MAHDAETKEINKINKRTPNNNKHNRGSSQGFRQDFNNRGARSNKNNTVTNRGGYADNNSIINNCRYCAESHPRGRCGAWGKNCNNCGKPNHAAKCCRSKKVDNINQEQFSNEEEYEQCDFNNVGLYGLEVTDDWTAWGRVAEINIPFKLDTGAQANILPTSELNRMHPRPNVKRTSTRLTAYNGTNIPVVGEMSIPVEIKDKTQTINFTVVEGNHRPILGLKHVKK